jgi:putative peptide zinc metalloprotease protein
MLQLRPTFSESWYRVAGLKAKLRSSAQISRQYYRGERWYVVRDPAGNQYHRLSDAAYRFVGLLDGTRTVAEAWDLVGGQLADDSPTQPEVIQILSQLYAANLMEADITPDATVLLRRHKQLMKRQLQGRLMNILFPRIPIWDPDRFLKRWMPVAQVFLSKAGIVLWLLVVIAGIAKVAPMMTELKQAAANSIDPSNWMLLWVTFALIKFWHELGHAMMCRRFGGEVHEMGIMFLVFIPTPYVDASTAWAFPSRWQRMAVGAAGMIFELFLASILAFVWAATADHTLVHQLCFNAMLVASVTTVIFNANPLLRYDGYYMLSDFLEIPNLQQKSQEYLLGLIKRHIFRIKPRQPLPPPLQRIWLFVYGLASTAYRVFVGVMIIMVVAFKVPVLGILMAMGGVMTWIAMPVMKLTRYLSLDPELHRKRGRATAFALAVAAAAVVAVGVLRFPVHYRAEGVTEAEAQAVLHAGMPGFVTDIRVKDGDYVKAGAVLVVLKDDDLELAAKTEVTEIEETVLKIRSSKVDDPNQEESFKVAKQAHEAKLKDAREKLDMLIIKAPMDGMVVAPKLKYLNGKFVPRGAELLSVQSMDNLLIRVLLEQKDAQLWAMTDQKQLMHPDKAKAEAEIRMAGAITNEPLKSRDIELIPAAQRDLPHPSLGTAGGGEVQTNPKDPSKPMMEQFVMRVKVANLPGAYDGKQGQFFPGQRAYLRFTLDEKWPLMKNWWRRLQQLIGTYSKTRWAT